MAVLIEELQLTALTRGRPVPFDKLDLTVAYNQAGSFVLDMPANDRTWELIQLDGNGELVPVGLLINWNGVFEIPLKAEDWAFKRSLADGKLVETLTLIGTDFLSLLANRVAYPNPAAAWSSQTVTSTSYTGVAETVIKTIVTANVKTAGDTNRRVPLLTVASDLGRGGSVTYKVTTPNPSATTGTQTVTVSQSLMDMVRAVDAQSPMGVRVTYNSGALVFDCYVPRNLSGKAVFSPRLGNLPEAGLTASEPTVNVALVQSKVTGSLFQQFTGHGAVDPWRRVEAFSDQSSTDTQADITTAGTSAIADGAARVRIDGTIVDLPRLRFGADATGVQGYREGDTVALDIRDGITYSDIVSKVQLVADATGDKYTETVTPTVGVQDSTDQTINSKLAAKVRRIEKALRGSV